MKSHTVELTLEVPARMDFGRRKKRILIKIIGE